MEKALQGRQKYLKASIFRPLQGSVKTTPYPQGLRPGLEICRPLRGCVERLNGVLQQSQFFAPTMPPLADVFTRLASGTITGRIKPFPR